MPFADQGWSIVSWPPTMVTDDVGDGPSLFREAGRRRFSAASSALTRAVPRPLRALLADGVPAESKATISSVDFSNAGPARSGLCWKFAEHLGEVGRPLS